MKTFKTTEFFANSTEVKAPKAECHIYFLFKEDELVYVGQSISLFNRISQHQGNKDFDTLRYIEVEKDDCSALELALIKTFQPRHNTAGKFRVKLTPKESAALAKYNMHKSKYLARLSNLEAPKRGEYGAVAVRSRGVVRFGLYDNDDDIDGDHDDECLCCAIQERMEEKAIGETEESRELMAELCDCEPLAIVYFNDEPGSYRVVDRRSLLSIPHEEEYEDILRETESALLNGLKSARNKAQQGEATWNNESPVDRKL